MQRIQIGCCAKSLVFNISLEPQQLHQQQILQADQVENITIMHSYETVTESNTNYSSRQRTLNKKITLAENNIQ